MTVLITQPTTCDNCGTDIGLLVLAHAAIDYGDLYFCCICCLDEYLDAVEVEA